MSEQQPAPDAYADMRAQLDALYSFLRARTEEGPVISPSVHQVLGFAMGYATACVENRDIVGAARKLEWMRTEAQDWAEHPDFPAEARR